MIQLHLAYWAMVTEIWSVIMAVDTPPAKPTQPPCVVLDFVEFKRSNKTVLPKYILR